MSDLIDSDLEFDAMCEEFYNYKKLKGRDVSASDWVMAWNYAREFVLGIVNKQIDELQRQLDEKDKEFERFARK